MKSPETCVFVTVHRYDEETGFFAAILPSRGMADAVADRVQESHVGLTVEQSSIPLHRSGKSLSPGQPMSVVVYSMDDHPFGVGAYERAQDAEAALKPGEGEFIQQAKWATWLAEAFPADISDLVEVSDCG